MMTVTEAFTAWFEATNPGKAAIAQALSVIDDAPPLAVARRFLAFGYTAEPGWPSQPAAFEADRLTDAEYKKRALGDDGSSFTPGDYRVQFLARLVEDEWSKAGGWDEPAPVADPDMRAALAAERARALSDARAALAGVR